MFRSTWPRGLTIMITVKDGSVILPSRFSNLLHTYYPLLAIALRTMNGISSDDNHHQLDDSSNDVQWLLDRVNIFERSPKGLLEAWQLAQQSEPTSTTRIFLDQGKCAWLAYHLSKAAADQPTHFTGQSHLRRKISELEKTPSAYRTSIAEKLEAELGSDVRDKIERWWTTSNRQRATKRRAPSEERRSPSPTASIASSLAVARGPSTVYPAFSTSGNVAEYEHVLVNASLAETVRLVPLSLSDAIRRVPDPGDENSLVASISMSFPNVRSDFGCQMALEIMENKIDNLARDLFDVKLETTAGLRYVCFSEGAKILPNPKFTIRGCRHDVISKAFGNEISSAVAASPAYQEDLKQWRGRTDCVWMVISHKANDTAQLCLSMELFEGTLIQRKLYR
ncbi:hypothetical protein VFPPC_17006 [Pochonia chlamydosporia 170]|uniref:Uncharacterized protein n=1 Tax=Pochonia chlamydosporia 170 TaxID=1380566 RepID=A0A179EYL4_METCM|nr:hypothetical protein VFPPC_17006 [Pochonia chlamydosporia 170]OAQ58271.1 hypothetical protein VFPPC_17006 [Pochonia chlamydosporia 170]